MSKINLKPKLKIECNKDSGLCGPCRFVKHMTLGYPYIVRHDCILFETILKFVGLGSLETYRCLPCLDTQE
jgi:hypothetical protein